MIQDEKHEMTQVSERVLTIRNTQVIIDRDVADIYGLTTKRINEAVKNNPDKFPEGYIISLTDSEKGELVEIFDRFGSLKHSTVMPKAFTEKGLYMLATILKSPVATEATIAIIETFTKIRVLARAIEDANNGNGQPETNKLQQLMTEVFTNNLPVQMKKTTFTINTGFIKFSVETTRKKEE